MAAVWRLCGTLLLLAVTALGQQQQQEQQQRQDEDRVTSFSHSESNFGFPFPFKAAREFVDDFDEKLDEGLTVFSGEQFASFPDSLGLVGDFERVGDLPLEGHYPHPPIRSSRAPLEQTKFSVRDPNLFSSSFREYSDDLFSSSESSMNNREPVSFQEDDFFDSIHDAPQPFNVKKSRGSHHQISEEDNEFYQPKVFQEIHFDAPKQRKRPEETPLRQKKRPEETPLRQKKRPEETPLRQKKRPEETLLRQSKRPEETPPRQRKRSEETHLRQRKRPEETPRSRDVHEKRSPTNPIESSYDIALEKEDYSSYDIALEKEDYQPPVYVPQKHSDPYKSHSNAHKKPKPHHSYKREHDTYKHSKPVHEPYKSVHDVHKHKPVHDTYKPSKPVHDTYKPPHSSHKPNKHAHDLYKPIHDSYKPIHDSYKPSKPVHHGYKPSHHSNKPIHKPDESIYKRPHGKPKLLQPVYPSHKYEKPLHDPYKPLDDHHFHEEKPYKKNSIPGVPGKDFPTYSVVPYTDFSCSSVPYRPGMYANVEAHCQAYHVCHDERYGKQGASFLCTNGTLFNQKTFTCDWWYKVDCSRAKQYYELNADPHHNPYYQKPYEGPIHIPSPSYDPHNQHHGGGYETSYSGPKHKRSDVQYKEDHKSFAPSSFESELHLETLPKRSSSRPFDHSQMSDSPHFSSNEQASSTGFIEFPSFKLFNDENTKQYRQSSNSPSSQENSSFERFSRDSNRRQPSPSKRLTFSELEDVDSHFIPSTSQEISRLSSQERSPESRRRPFKSLPKRESTFSPNPSSSQELHDFFDDIDENGEITRSRNSQSNRGNRRPNAERKDFASTRSRASEADSYPLHTAQSDEEFDTKEHTHPGGATSFSFSGFTRS